MRRVALLALMLVVVLAHVSLLPALRPLGVVPDVALVFVVLLGLESTASTAVAAAVVCGLALDLSSGTNMGMWTGLLLLAAIVTGMLHRAGVETGGPLVPSVIIVAGTFLATLIILTGLLTTVSWWPAGLLARQFALELMLNLILMVALRPLVRRVVPSAPPDMTAMG